MSMITTAAELRTLPDGAVVLDRDGDAWMAHPEGWYRATRNAARTHANALVIFAPLTVLHVPGPSPLHMVRCCVTGCTTTAPLAPGSTLICPEHGGEHHDIATKGDGS